MTVTQTQAALRRQPGMAVRQDFPILDRLIHGKPFTYLDSTATTQKPLQVIDAMAEYFSSYNANIHRGVYTVAEEATARHEESRSKIARFVGAASPKEIIFVRNATEAINLVAYCWGRQHLKPGDEIILTEMEHHANLVPWFITSEQLGFKIRYIPITPEGELDLSVLPRLLTDRTRLVSITHMSNVLGTINPVREIADAAHRAGALCLVDGAQSVPHMPVNVQELGCDFVAFSAHKMLGPTGVGALYGRRQILEAMPVFMGGGEMIRQVTFEGFTPTDLPWKFEAGTPAIMEDIVFGVAVDYLESMGMPAVRRHEESLMGYALDALSSIHGLTIYGPPAPKRGGVVAFSMAGVHPHDVATILDEDGIAVRAGHHCAQPLHNKLGIPASTRASFYVYSIPEEVDRLVASLRRVQKVFRV
jgi:cysteine desulfurase/selenocysteine lyase